MSRPRLLTAWGLLLQLSAVSVGARAEEAGDESGHEPNRAENHAEDHAAQQPAVALLDVTVCEQSDSAAPLIQALELESSFVSEVRLVRSGAQAPSENQRVGIRIVDCTFESGTLHVEVDQGPAQREQRALDLEGVPSVVRARTAAVALLEWARSLAREGKDAPQVPARRPGHDLATRAPAPAPGDSAGPLPVTEATPDEAPGEEVLPATDGSEGPPTSERPPPWIAEFGLGFELTHAPTPAGVRIDASIERRIFRGWRGSLGVLGAYLGPTSRQGRLDAWLWGAELALGHAWGHRAEVSLWGLASFDGVTLHGTTLNGQETNSESEPLVSASVRAKVRKVFDSGIVVGAAVDGGWFVLGARFTALGEPVANFEGFRIGARMGVGYAF